LEIYQAHKKEEDRRKKESLAMHRKNLEKIEDNSNELREYLKQNFDKQRRLTNCKGEKAWCGRLNECTQNSTRVQSQTKLVDNSYSYVQCFLMLMLYDSLRCSKKYVM